MLSGKFMSGYEDYATDQFPLREQFRTLKALTGLYVFGQKDNNGVYLARTATPPSWNIPLNEGSVDHAADRFRYLYENLMAGRGRKGLPLRHPRQELLSRGGKRLSRHGLSKPSSEALRKQTDFAQYIDLFGHADRWTITTAPTPTGGRKGCLTVAADTLAACDGRDAARTTAIRSRMLDRPYYGVYYGYAALPMEPDQLRLPHQRHCWRTARSTTTRPASPAPVYDHGKRCAGKDPYELFLSGSDVAADRSKIRTRKPTGSWSIFRDSFGSSLAPLLVPGLRQGDAGGYPLSSQQPDGQATGPSPITDVLFLYSAPVLNNSETLK